MTQMPQYKQGQHFDNNNANIQDKYSMNTVAMQHRYKNKNKVNTFITITQTHNMGTAGHIACLCTR